MLIFVFIFVILGGGSKKTLIYVKECPAYAIRFFLGADMGGMGSVLYTKKDGDIIRWITEKADGSVSEIQVDTRVSNKY